jgi:hypothetical protein
MSTALPAVSGTTARIVFVGHCCAVAVTDASPARVATKHHPQRLIITSLCGHARDVSARSDTVMPQPEQICNSIINPYGRELGLIGIS